MKTPLKKKLPQKNNQKDASCDASFCSRVSKNPPTVKMQSFCDVLSKGAPLCKGSCIFAQKKILRDRNKSLLRKAF